MELLADRAALGLSLGDEAELVSLLREAPGVDADAMDRAAASLDLALNPSPTQALPAALRAKVAADARGFMATSAARTARNAADERPAVIARVGPPRDTMLTGPMAGPSISSLGWLAAAACLALAAMAWFSDRPTNGTFDPSNPSLAKERLVASAPDLTRWDWVSIGELEGTLVRGEAVWSSSRQKGYMSFAGLRPNDPTAEQYQLWIFDPSQSDMTPIDGGVFNIRPTDSGEAVVPIDPKLRPSGPVMFAVTIEKPGGVVVSDRKRLVLIAKPA